MSWRRSGLLIEPLGDTGLYLVPGLYRLCRDGELRYDGERPGPTGHAHGHFPRFLKVPTPDEVRRIVLWKQRWLEVETRGTCHSRPPDDPILLACSTVCVALLLWSWLDRGRGVHSFEGVWPGIEQAVSARTAQRYLARLLPDALRLQQAIRRAVMERCEPRPLEQLFPSGLSPPVGLLHRQWRAPDSVSALWRGLKMLVGGAAGLDVSIPVLLAEAREEVT